VARAFRAAKEWQRAGSRGVKPMLQPGAPARGGGTARTGDRDGGADKGVEKGVTLARERGKAAGNWPH